MSNKSTTPSESVSEPMESRRAALPDPDPAQATPDAGVESATDLPELGEFSPEAARPTPLDDIAEAERENAPRD